MKTDTDALVHRVLQGLAAINPSQGLEDRVLAHTRTHEASRTSWLEAMRWRMRTVSLNWAAPVAVAAAVMVGAVLLHAPHSAPRNTARTATTLKPAAQPGDSVPSPAPNIIALQKSSHVLSPRHSVIRKEINSTQPKPLVVSNNYDTLAMEEWRAPSTPAPELPLTHEERLLQRYARHGDTDELAALTPAFRAAEHAREQVEFKQFFNKLPNGENQ